MREFISERNYRTAAANKSLTAVTKCICFLQMNTRQISFLNCINAQENGAAFLLALPKTWRIYVIEDDKHTQRFKLLAQILDVVADHAVSGVDVGFMGSNTDFVMMLNQATSDRVQLARLLNISDNLLAYVTNSDSGQGLICCKRKFAEYSFAKSKYTSSIYIQVRLPFARFSVILFQT